MSVPDEALNGKTYVTTEGDAVFIRQNLHGDEEHEIELSREDALKLAEWLATYCLNQFATGQGTGE